MNSGPREAFVLQHSASEFIVYSPRSKRLLLVDRELGRKLWRGAQGSDELSPLRDLLSQEEISIEREATAWDPQCYKPASLALALNLDCNLRCVYCHANAGAPATYAEWTMLRDAIDSFLARVQDNKQTHAGLSFAGGGEPTLAWDMLVKCVEYFEAATQQRNLKHEISMATNGTMSESQCQYVIGHFRGVSLSLDGPVDIHNAHRPGIGLDSHSAAIRTGKQFSEANFPFGVRATVTTLSVTRLPEIVRYFVSEMPNVRGIGLEPLFKIGRGASLMGRLQAPTLSAFTEAWIKAYEEGSRLGVQVVYSGAGQFDAVRPLFCGAVTGPDMTITWDGYVSACNRDNPDEFFRVGKYNGTGAGFEIDTFAVERVKRAVIAKRVACEGSGGCFWIYHCAGDCFDLQRRTGTVRCSSIRTIGYHHLCRKLGIPPNKKLPAFRRILV